MLVKLAVIRLECSFAQVTKHAPHRAFQHIADFAGGLCFTYAPRLVGGITVDGTLIEACASLKSFQRT